MDSSRCGAGPARARARLSGFTLRSLVAEHEVLAPAAACPSGNDGTLTWQCQLEAPNPFLSFSLRFEE